MKKNWLPEIAELVLTSVLAGVSLLASQQTAVTVLFVGISIALATFLIRRELARQLSERLELYQLLDSVPDDSLRAEHGYEIIRHAVKEMKDLRDGIVTLAAENVYLEAIKNMKAMNKGQVVRAVHTAHDGLAYLYAWGHAPLTNYFEANCEAKRREVKIKRIFVIRKADVHDARGRGHYDDELMAILRKQTECCTHVYVAWFEDLEAAGMEGIVRDFIVFGNSTVQYQTPAGGRYCEAKLYTSPSDVREYTDLFHRLRSSACLIQEALVQLGAATEGS